LDSKACKKLLSLDFSAPKQLPDLDFKVRQTFVGFKSSQKIFFFNFRDTKAPKKLPPLDLKARKKFAFSEF